jgi:hypothetical protein
MDPVTDEAQTFNTPLEAGLRALFLLAAAGRRALDLERLIYFDYAMVHSGDFDGPSSLHPATPSQGAQLLVRRALLQHGLELMRSRDLVERRYGAAGIRYRATEIGRHVADQFASRYAASLRERAAWVDEAMRDRSDRDLQMLFAARVRPLARDLVVSKMAGEFGTSADV